MKNWFIHKAFRSCVLILLWAPLGVYAQKSDLGNWLIYFGNKKIDSKWNWHHEVQLRNYNAIGDLEQLLLRTGIGYNLTENNNNLMVGYAYIQSENYIGNTDSKTSVGEHRLFQQFITRQAFGRIKLLHRYRFELAYMNQFLNGGERDQVNVVAFFSY